MRANRILASFVFLAILAVAGCDGGEDVAAPVADAAPVAIVETVWAVESLAGKPVVAGSDVTLMLGDRGQISGHAGCNRYMGRYKMTADGAMTFPAPVATTRMACIDPATAEQERVYIDLLGRVKKIVLGKDNVLVLTAENGREIRYIAAPAQQKMP